MNTTQEARNKFLESGFGRSLQGKQKIVLHINFIGNFEDDWKNNPDLKITEKDAPPQSNTNMAIATTSNIC